MAYTKTYVPEKYEEIRDLLKKVQQLEEGEKVRLRGLDHESLTHVRWLVYDWLHHNNLKQLYRVSVREGVLVVIRRGLPKGAQIETDAAPLPARLITLLNQMIEEESSSLAVSQWKEGNINEQEYNTLINHYSRVMS